MLCSSFMKTGGSRLRLEIPRQGLASPGAGAALLVAGAAGRTAGGGLFLRFAGRAAGGASPARQIRKRHSCVPPMMFVEPVSRFALLS